MGLDITAYKNLTKVHTVTEDEDVWSEGLTTLYNNKDFPNRFEGVEEGVAYSCEERFGFCAGSYSGYSHWRELLAKLAGYNGANEEDDKPFFELINFSDCEGTIGPVVSAKLAKDFADHQAEAEADVMEEDEWGYFKQCYADWRKAFEMAADNGAVSFH
jgi:hypothetical protein